MLWFLSFSYKVGMGRVTKTNSSMHSPTIHSSKDNAGILILAPHFVISHFVISVDFCFCFWFWSHERPGGRPPYASSVSPQTFFHTRLAKWGLRPSVGCNFQLAVVFFPAVSLHPGAYPSQLSQLSAADRDRSQTLADVWDWMGVASSGQGHNVLLVFQNWKLH